MARLFSAVVLLALASLVLTVAPEKAVASALNGVEYISAGGDHTCALSTSGGVLCWGLNNAGQLGTGANSGPELCEGRPCSTTPVIVAGLASGVEALSSGSEHTCALTVAGGVKCWGYNYFGQLGDGTTQNSASPVNVTGLTSGVVAISSGGAHTCALTVASSLKCWGFNQLGQLGNGAFKTSGCYCSSTPVDVIGLPSGLLGFSAGGLETCALTNSGGAKCWGYNYFGQLGDGTTLNSATPVDVSGLTQGVAAISTGGQHACALTDEGAAKCWGENDRAQLGNGTSTGPEICQGNFACSSVPVGVQGLSSGVQVLSAGNFQTCALTKQAVVRCWGNNQLGAVGNGSSVGPESCYGFPCSTLPVDVVDLVDNVTEISAQGYYHVCVSLSDTTARCWGDARSGQLGVGTSTGPEDCFSGTCSTRPVPVFAYAKAVGGSTALTNALSPERTSPHRSALLPFAAILFVSFGGAAYVARRRLFRSR